MPKGTKGSGNVVDMPGTTAGSNSKVRADRLRAGFAEIADQEDEIERQKLAVMKPLTDERTKLWRELKADMDIPRKVMELEYKMFKMAREAQRLEEGGDLVLDQMKEVFQALHPGNTIDWIAALERVEEGDWRVEEGD